MGRLVFAGATAHTGLMVRAADKVGAEQKASLAAGFSRFGDLLTGASPPDAMVIIAPDHFATFQLANMPTFAVGYGTGSQTWGDAGVPVFDVEFDDALGRSIAAELIGAGFDVATAYNMRLDHAYACPLHLILPDLGIPIVPIFINCAAPPLPSLERCFQLGSAVRDAIDRSGGDRRIAVMATGGLSHWTPAPSLHSPKDALDRKMIDFLLAGDRAGFSAAMRERVDQWSNEAGGRVAEEFDREFLASAHTGSLRDTFSLDFETIERRAGNGGQEIRTWVAGAGVARSAPGETIVYEPVNEWLTGIGLFSWRV